MKNLAVIGLGLIYLCTAKCNSTIDKKLADSINHFTLNLYGELIKTEKDNVMCSGFSLSSVLTMLLVGARGNTSSEINKTLGYERFGLSEQQIKDSFRHLLTVQRGNHSGYDLEVANSIWLQSGFNVLPDFISTINDNLFVEEKQINFGNSSDANAQINAWVNEKTKGRIPTLFDDPLDPSTRLVLANAVYFKGSWLEKFDEDFTRDVIFISKDNANAIPMMYINKDFQYADNSSLNARILELPYTGEDVGMVVVLPRSNDGLEALENELTLDSLNEAIDRMAESDVRVTLPKFKISSKLPLNTVLQSLGIVKAFSSSEADLSGINGETNLSVSDSIQKADIEVNEEGTVAAAASGIALAEMGPSPVAFNFLANHPFLFIVRQKSTGIILFIGRVAKL